MNINKYLILIVLSLSGGILLLFYEPFLRGIVSLSGALLNRDLDFSFWRIGFEKTGVELLVLSANTFLALFFYKRNPERFILFSCLLWILVFIIYVIGNAVNVPLGDDYIFFLQFLNNYSSTQDIQTVVQQTPYIESRLILMHLIALVLFYLKVLNFKILIFFSTFCFVGIALLFERSIQTKQWVSPKESQTTVSSGKALLFLIIVLLFFQFQDYDSIVYASASLYTTCTIFFVFCSLYLLNRPSLWTFVLSLFLIFLSILSNGCGFVGVMCGIILLISQKRGKHLLIWMLFSILISIFYFTDYTFFRDPVFFDFTSFIYTIYKSLVFSCTFLGSPFQFLYRDTIPLIIGGIIWVYWIILTLQKYYKKNPVIYFMLLFLIVTSCLPSPLFRSAGLLYVPLTIPITVHYGIYAMMSVCCCIIAFFETTTFRNKQRLMIYFLVLSFFYHLSSNIFFYPEMVLRRERLMTFIQHFKRAVSSQKNKEQGDKEPPSTAWVPNGGTILKESISKNIYKFPDEYTQ